MSDINFFGETTYRNVKKKFGIKVDDRRRHFYAIGKTGMGKTNLLANMAIQDIQQGRGIGFVDPHGEAAEALLDFIPSRRVNDVVYINPADIDFPVAFNVMEQVKFEHRHLVAGGLMGVFKKIWPDVWSARMEYILNNSILALLEYPGSTLLGINRMLSDPEFRKKVVDSVGDPMVKAFWINEFARYTQRYEVEATAAIQNKVGQFISAPLIRNIIGQVKSTINMREIMDSGKILILNLSKGRIGEDNSMLLGNLLITKLQLAAMQRVDTPEEERKDFFLYVDEFQNFATESFTNILSEARKYRLALILAHQYIAQMDEKVRDAVFGNVGTLVSFRVGAEDADYLEKEFSPDFVAEDLVNLGKYDIYLKLLINGIAGRPFSAKVLPPFPREEISNREKIIKVSREKYGNPRKKVEDNISEWSGFFDLPEMSESFVSALPRQGQAGQALYDAICSLCKKPTKIIFPPDGRRPVYCKACFKKVKGGEGNKPQTAGQIGGQGQTNSQAGQAIAKPQNSEHLPQQPIRQPLSQQLPQSSQSPQPQPENTISLESALEREPVYFGGSKKNPDDRKKKNKIVDLTGLREILKDTIKQTFGKNQEQQEDKNLEKTKKIEKEIIDDIQKED